MDGAVVHRSFRGIAAELYTLRPAADSHQDYQPIACCPESKRMFISGIRHVDGRAGVLDRPWHLDRSGQ